MALTEKQQEQLNNLEDRQTPKAQQGSQPPKRPAQSGRSRQATESNALAVHQNWDALAQGLADSSDQRLATLASALIANREQQAVAFVNLLESAEDGSLDQKLIMQEWMRRKQARTTNYQDFNVEPTTDTDFDPKIETINMAVVTAGFYQSPIRSLPSK